VLALTGPLGAGKTAFARGLAEGLGIPPAVVASPTFVIAHEYEGPAGQRLAHVDLYRVASLGELEAAGFLDLLEPGAVVVVEWADRLPQALPSDHLELRIERPESRAGSARRVLHARASGETSEATLVRWREALAAPNPGASGAENRSASPQTRSDAS
jgi:tRNA threonylcarbamoyladenosine biosynthesis protein TsaE